MDKIQSLYEILKDDSKYVLQNINLEYFIDKKILITGASGLIGLHLVMALKETNYDFQCFCIVNSSSNDLISYITNDDNRFILIKYDLTDEVSLFKYLYDFYGYFLFDIIFHMATYGQPNLIFNDESYQEQLKTIRLNTSVTMDLLSALKKDGKFIYMSSSEIYQGLQGMHQECQIGTTNTEHTRACYIEAKRCGETICNIYRNSGYDVHVIRLCLGYGTGVKESDRRVLNQFIYDGLTKKKIELKDEGYAIRTYCYVSDVIVMMLNIMFEGNHLIYNVGSSHITTIRGLAQDIASKLNAEVFIPDMDNKIIGSVNCAILNRNRYTDEFDNRLLISLSDGLNKTIKWWKVLLNK